MKVKLSRVRTAQRGVSLVEMLGVVALLGLLLGIAAPNFIKIRRIGNVNRAANSVYLGLVRARQIALHKGKPVIIKVNATASTLQFLACLDNNFYTGTPGSDGTSFACTGGDLPAGAAGSFTVKESPFGAGIASLQINMANPNVSLGYPNGTSSAYTAAPTNFPTPTGVNWFAFDASGKLLPDGASPFLATQTVIQLPHQPAITPALPPGGPEFYIAEFNPVANDSRPRNHVYRKISISGYGGVSIESWVVNPAGGGAWTGLK